MPQPALDPSVLVRLVAVAVVFAIALVMILGMASLMHLWLRAYVAGVRVSLLELLGMRFRKVPPAVVVDSLILAAMGGVEDDDVTSFSLSAHYLAGCDIRKVVEALVEARRRNSPMTFREAAAIDLSGKDVLEAVRGGQRDA